MQKQILILGRKEEEGIPNFLKESAGITYYSNQNRYLRPGDVMGDFADIAEELKGKQYDMIFNDKHTSKFFPHNILTELETIMKPTSTLYIQEFRDKPAWLSDTCGGETISVDIKYGRTAEFKTFSTQSNCTIGQAVYDHMKPNATTGIKPDFSVTNENGKVENETIVISGGTYYVTYKMSNPYAHEFKTGKLQQKGKIVINGVEFRQYQRARKECTYGQKAEQTLQLRF